MAGRRLEYDELRIRIAADGRGGFRTEANGRIGTASSEFVPPFAIDDIDEIVDQISGQVGKRTTSSQVDTTRRVEPPDYALVKHLGGSLFDALFDGDIRDLYYGSLRGARERGKGLRISLALTDVPKLTLVPWEYLHDDDFLSISDRTPIVRYLDLKRTHEPLEIERPLRILAMVSAPKDVVELDVKQERRKIDTALEALTKKGSVDIEWVEEATLDELHIRLMGAPYHVFHFIGHGEFDEAEEDGVLSFEDERGREDRVNGLHLGATLATNDSLRLAVLNSCEGGRSADDDPFAGVASSLVKKHIPAVIAMQFEVTDRAAVTFSDWLYKALAAGYPVDGALAQARLALFRRKGLEWGTPVLFMRVQDGRVFDVPDDDDGDAVWHRVLRRASRDKKPLLIAAALAAVLLAAILGFAVLSDGGGKTETPQADLWSASSVTSLDGFLGIASDGSTSSVGVGLNGSRPAIRAYHDGVWSDTGDLAGSGRVNTVAVAADGIAVAGGRVVDEGEDDAGIWKRSGQQWSLTCLDQDCGDGAPGSGSQRQEIKSMAATPTGFVAVGLDTRNDSRDGAVWSSQDGVTWRRVAAFESSLGGSENQIMNGVVAVGSRLIVVGSSGSDGATWRSTDRGEHWTKGPSLHSDAGRLELLAVTRWRRSLIAVGRETRDGRYGAAAWISGRGGQSWRRTHVADAQFRGEQQMVDVVVTPTGLLAVGVDLSDPNAKKEAAVWKSTTGESWTRVASTSFSRGQTQGMSGIAVLGDGTTLAVGSGQDAGAPGGGRSWTTGSEAP